jgi:hypothetical protein
MDRLSHRELTMNPGRVRRLVVAVVAALAVGLGIYVLTSGIASAEESTWTQGSSTGISATGNGGASAATFNPFESTWT